MKEYKVIKPKLGFIKTSEKLEDLLNTYAIKSWSLHSITTSHHGYIHVILEREKNR